jgi:acyl-CoA synthetase (AMP-forming)/AMP-acid ligase II
VIEFPPLTIPQVISLQARAQPEQCAVICQSTRMTWREFGNRVHKVANALLAAGLEKGDTVCLLMNNSAEMLELMLGTIKAGGVVAPLSPLMSHEVVAELVAHAQSHFLAAGEDTAEHVRKVRDQLATVPDSNLIAVGFDERGWRSYEDWLAPASESDPDIPIDFGDSISILYTSGTTGAPKGMEHSHFARLLYPLVLGRLLKIDHTSRSILSTPMCHNGTWIPMLPALYAGGAVIILPRFSTRAFLSAVAELGGTHTFFVPTQLQRLVSDPDLETYDTSNLRLIELAGAPLATSTFEAAQQKLPHVELCELYGMAEGFMTYIGPYDYARGKKGSVGRPITAVGTEIRLLDDDGNEVPSGEVGEVVGRSGFLLKGYYNDPVRTTDAIWTDPAGRHYLRSGDLARFDEDGYLYVVGRKKDMIITGGENVYADEIENIFMRHPDVLEVAAIGIPHDTWGETPLLLAIMRDGAGTTADELKEWGNARLGKIARVSAVEFREEFPRNTLHKILKRELREPYWRGRERDI